MKRKIVKLCNVLLVCILGACSQSPDGYKITCEIEGLNDGTVLELIPAATYKDEKSIASSSVTNGKFEFEGNVEECRLFRIVVVEDGLYGSFPVMVENGEIAVKGKVTLREQGNRKTYSFDDITVTGSSAHDLYLEKISPKKDLNKLYEGYQTNNKEIFDKVNAARDNNDQELLSVLYNSKEWMKLVEDEKNFFDTVSKTMTNMVLDNADSWWGPFLMLDQMSYLTKEQEVWWNQFSDEAKGSYYGKIVFEELFPEGLKDKPAPDFTVTTDDGIEIPLAKLLEGKKYVLIDFWASWCKPCRNEIPNFKRIYDIFSPKGFEIISISTDKSAEDWKKALDEENLPWPNYLDKSDIATIYKVKLIPTTYLVNESGIIIEENLKGEELMSKLKELMP